MAKVMTAILAFVLMTITIPGWAEKAASPGLQQGFACSVATAGSSYTATVAGIGANWWATNKFPFTVIWHSELVDYTITESGAWSFTDSAGKLMLVALTAAYLMRTNVTLYCDGKGTVTSVWLGEGKP
ncbi:hypothetical protein [Bordetella genomosp. 11]|uniref:Uncharacterized protein n=1 Tax=Bordetella genomosp. 11 TaxID=1416808 RepID=A0A261UZK3_9BORD|nr:hypothetical protein [Bordetella genomosp. 11]OZI66343.1 hypothetical protein CAL28_00930 [Bordetella genomosp. 11]